MVAINIAQKPWGCSVGDSAYAHAAKQSYSMVDLFPKGYCLLLQRAMKQMTQHNHVK